MDSRAGEVVLAYDASCGPCSRFKAVVEFLDARKRVRFVSLEAADRSGLLANVAPGSRYSSFHLILRSSPARHSDPKSGSEALPSLLRSLSPWGSVVSRAIETVPGGMKAASFAYSTLSRLHQSCSVRRE